MLKKYFSKVFLFGFLFLLLILREDLRPKWQEMSSAGEYEVPSFSVDTALGYVSPENQESRSDSIGGYLFGEGSIANNSPAETVSAHVIDDELNKVSSSGEKSALASSSSAVISGDYVAPNNPYMPKTVMGFAPYWSFSYYSKNYQMDNLSILSYFSLPCNGDGSFYTAGVEWSVWNSTDMQDMISRAHAKGVKVVPVIKSFYNVDIYNIVTNTGGAKDLLFSNLVNEIQNKNADGVNVDFEFISEYSSTNCGGGPCSWDRVRPHITTFMSDLASLIHSEFPGSHVSIDVYGGSATWNSAYDISSIGSSSVDAIMVMSYDLHKSQPFASPTSPLYGSQYICGGGECTVSKFMRDFKSKAPAGKILMGIPYYGTRYATNDYGYNSGLRCSGVTTPKYFEIMPWVDVNPSAKRWNSSDKVRWVVYDDSKDGCSTGPFQTYYEDVDSLSAKYDYVNKEGLGGIAIWTLSYGDERQELWDTIRDKFSMIPFRVLFKDDLSREDQDLIHAQLGAEIVMRMPNRNDVIVRPVSKRSYDLIQDYRNHPDVWVAGFTEYWQKYSMYPFRVMFQFGTSRETQDSIHSKLGGIVIRYYPDGLSAKVRPVSEPSEILIQKYSKKSEVVAVSLVEGVTLW